MDNLKLISNKEYLLLVDTEIKKSPGLWAVADSLGNGKDVKVDRIKHTTNGICFEGEAGDCWAFCDVHVITAHRPLTDAPKQEGVLLLPPLKSNPLDRRKEVYMVQNPKAGKDGNLTIYVQLYMDLEEAKELCKLHPHLQIRTEWIVMPELPKQNDVERLAFEAYPETLEKWGDPEQYYDINEEDRNIWIAGYNAATQKSWSEASPKFPVDFIPELKTIDTPEGEQLCGAYIW